MYDFNPFNSNPVVDISSISCDLPSLRHDAEAALRDELDINKIFWGFELPIRFPEHVRIKTGVVLRRVRLRVVGLDGESS